MGEGVLRSPRMSRLSDRVDEISREAMKNVHSLIDPGAFFKACIFFGAKPPSFPLHLQ